MYQKKRIWFLIFDGLLVLGVTTVIVFILFSRPETIDPEPSLASEIQLVITRMYRLQSTIVCNPDTDVEVLAEVLMDSLDYKPSPHDLDRIQSVLGYEALKHAGYLTSQKAYFLSRRSVTPTAPQPGIKPTQPPVYYCSDPPSKINVNFIRLALQKDGRAVVRYDYGGGIWEATLRQVSGRWMISSVKLMQWEGV